MPERKTQQTDADVGEFITTVANETRRSDATIAAKLLHAVTGEPPKMWGTGIVGCGKHHYTYANGRPAEICKIGFAPRSRSLVFYLADFETKAALLEQLGPHSVKGGCLHINKLQDVNLGTLGKILEKAYRAKR